MLEHYLEVTESRRAYFAAAEGHRPHGLFISNLKPFQTVLPSTLAKWMLRIMSDAGVDLHIIKLILLGRLLRRICKDEAFLSPRS